MEILTKKQIQDFLSRLKNDQDEITRQTIQDQAENILQRFIDDDIDIEEDAYKIFADFLETFGTTTNENGEKVLTELGAKATAKYEQAINNFENADKEYDSNRIYSLNADSNQIKFDLVTLGVYQEMGLVSEEIKASEKTPSDIAKIIDEVKLTDEQKIEYSAKFVDTILSNRELFESVPPSMLANAYSFIKTAISESPDEETKQAYTERFNLIAERIDYLIETFNNRVDFYYADPSNIADIYDGYNKMCDIRQKDIKEKERLEEIKNVKNRLNSLMSEYEEIWNLSKLKPENAEELNNRWVELKQKISKIELSEEVIKTLANYKFLDEEGKEIPQFLDEDGKESLTYKKGYKINPKGRLAQVISLAKNDVVMQNVGDLSKSVKDMLLSEELDEQMPWTISDISIPDQIKQGIIQSPDKMNDEEYVNNLWNDIKTNGGEITDDGYQDALDASVNKCAGFSNILSRKIGSDKEVVYKPFEAIEDIDKLARTKSEKQGAEGRKKKIGFFKRIAKNFGMAAVVSAGLTFIGKATGIAYIGAAIGSVIGIGNMAYQGLKWRKEQKKQGKPHKIKDFFKNKRNWGPAIASGLGVAATISMATGNPGLAAAFGLGAVATASGSSAAMTYKDAIAAGYTKGQAVAGAIGVASSGFLGALAGNLAMNGVVNYVNNNTDSTLFKHETTTTTTTTTNQESTQRVYNDGVIEHNENILNRWENPAQLDARISGLMDQGLSHDDAVRYLLAFHDATDHNLGDGYFNSIGMSDSGLEALRGSISGNQVNLTPESISAFEHFNPHISGTNTVGYIAGAPIDYNLPANATYDANGVLIPGNDIYSTYVDHGPAFTDITTNTPITITDTSSIFTPNELAFPAGIGALGIYEPRVIKDEYFNNLKERAGAIADRIEKIEKQPNQDKKKTSKPETETIIEEPKSDTDRIKRPETETVIEEPKSDTGRNKRPETETIIEETKNKPIKEETTEKQQKRGFFGKMKDTIYKIASATKNGINKTIKGVQEMGNEVKQNRIKNQTEREKLKTDFEKARKNHVSSKHESDLEKIKAKSKEGLTKQRSKIQKSLEKLKGELKSEAIKNDAKRKEEIKDSIHNLELLKKDIESKKEKVNNATTLIDAQKLDSELQKLDIKIDKQTAQAEEDIKSIHTSGLQKRKNIRAENRKKRLAGNIDAAYDAGKGFRGFIKGIFSPTKQDITSAENALEIAKLNAKKNATKNIWNAAEKKIREIIKDSKLNDEQKNKMANKILESAQNSLD